MRESPGTPVISVTAARRSDTLPLRGTVVPIRRGALVELRNTVVTMIALEDRWGIGRDRQMNGSNVMDCWLHLGHLRDERYCAWNRSNTKLLFDLMWLLSASSAMHSSLRPVLSCNVTARKYKLRSTCPEFYLTLEQVGKNWKNKCVILLVQKNMQATYILNVYFVSYENGGLQVFSCFVHFLVKKTSINSDKCIEYGK